MNYSVVKIQDDRYGREVFIKFDSGHSPNPDTLVWEGHTYKSYGSLICSSKPRGFTYWSDDKSVAHINVVSLA